MAHPDQSLVRHRELIRPPYLNPLEMVLSAMAKRVCDRISESPATQVCCVRPSSSSSAASSAVNALSSAMARIGKQIKPSCRQAMPVQVIEGALRVRVRTRTRTQNHTLSFGLCGKGCLFVGVNCFSSSSNACLLTAFRPFARHAQPNNLAGRLSIFSPGAPGVVVLARDANASCSRY